MILENLGKSKGKNFGKFCTYITLIASTIHLNFGKSASCLMFFASIRLLVSSDALMFVE